MDGRVRAKYNPPGEPSMRYDLSNAKSAEACVCRGGRGALFSIDGDSEAGRNRLRLHTTTTTKKAGNTYLPHWV